MTSYRMLKPWWLPREDWTQLLAFHGGAPRCAHCDAVKDLSVDHIQPRHYAGPNDLGNLQFLCVPCNSRKGDRPDNYWRRPFYWDQVPNLDAMRGAQRMVYETITLDPDISQWFAQPTNLPAGKLYLLAWIVGAGKTLGVPAVALAINHLLTQNWPAVRRADRILVLTKDQAIRDQTAEGFTKEISGYGILPRPPRVFTLENGSDFDQTGFLDQYDIVVACVQQVWERNGKPRTNATEILNKFPLIFVDEPHFAVQQVRDMVQQASNSIVFGLTGSPVTAQGALLRDYVLLSQYTYDDAHRIDQSLKYLDDAEASRDNFVQLVRLNSAEVLAKGRERTVSDTHDPEYDANQLVPAEQVVNAVIRYLEMCDHEREMLGMFAEAAQHRDPEQVAVDLWYPAHAIISCASIPMAKHLCAETQAAFESNRRIYQAKNGWNATAAFTGQPLDGKSPWMRAKGMFDPEAPTYRVDDKCARILFVVDMAREGVNNPLCCVAGLTHKSDSEIEIVQRPIGRNLRAVTYLDKAGVRHVPPARLDRVHIIQHEACDSTAKIDEAISFVCNMQDELALLPTIADLLKGDALPEVDERETATRLNLKEKIAITAGVTSFGGDDWRESDGATLGVIDWATRNFAKDNPQKAERVAEWIGRLKNDPVGAWVECGHKDRLEDLPEVPIVLLEEEKHRLTDDELKDFVRRAHPDLFADIQGEISPGERRAYHRLYETWADSRMLPPVLAGQHIEDIRRQMSNEVMASLKGYIEGDWMAARNSAHSFVGAAVKRVLGVPEGTSAKNNGRYDTPQAHIVLERPDVANGIRGWARAQIIRKHCPQLARGFGGAGHGTQ